MELFLGFYNLLKEDILKVVRESQRPGEFMDIINSSFGLMGKSQVSAVKPILVVTHLFDLLTFPCLNHSTTKLKTSVVIWAVISEQWCVAGISVLSHMHTPPVDSFTLTWAREAPRPHFSSLCPHAKSWESHFSGIHDFPVYVPFMIGVPKHFILMRRLGIHLHVGCFSFLTQLRNRCCFPHDFGFAMGSFTFLGCCGFLLSHFGHDRAKNDSGIRFPSHSYESIGMKAWYA